jgi:hypothetical protein
VTDRLRNPRQQFRRARKAGAPPTPCCPVCSSHKIPMKGAVVRPCYQKSLPPYCRSPGEREPGTTLSWSAGASARWSGAHCSIVSSDGEDGVLSRLTPAVHSHNGRSGGQTITAPAGVSGFNGCLGVRMYQTASVSLGASSICATLAPRWRPRRRLVRRWRSLESGCEETAIAAFSSLQRRFLARRAWTPAALLGVGSRAARPTEPFRHRWQSRCAGGDSPRVLVVAHCANVIRAAGTSPVSVKR